MTNIDLLLKSAIKKNGYTITSIAKKMSISQSALTQQINNKTISLANVYRIADIMQCSVADILADDSQDIHIVCPHCERTLTLRIVTPDECSE